MVIDNIKTFDFTPYKGKRFLGIDLGANRIGFSLSDTSWAIASPFEVLTKATQAKLISYLSKTFEDYPIGLLLIGMPLNMNGSKGPAALKAEHMAQLLSNQFKCPIVLWDERLSTSAITRTMIEADLSRAKQKEVVDKMAATFVLQGFLDWIKYNKLSLTI